MPIGTLLQQMCVILLQIMLGYIGVRIGKITDRDTKFLSGFISAFLLPCTILSCADVQGGTEVLGLMFSAIGILLAFYIVCTLLCQLAGKKLRWSRGRTAVLVGTAALPNCGFIGIPIACAVLGDHKGLLFASAAMTAYNIWFFTYVECLFRGEGKPDLRSLITPTNVSTLVMLCLLGLQIQLPAPVQTFCKAVGGCTTPLALVIVGCMLAASDLKKLILHPLLYGITVMRGVVFPLLFMLVLLAVKADPAFSIGVITLAVCPSGSLSAVLSKKYGVQEELCGQAIAHSTLFMLVTVPAMVILASQLFPTG